MSSSLKERLLRKIANGFLENRDLLSDPEWRHQEGVPAEKAKDLRAGVALAIDLAIALAPMFGTQGLTVESECYACHQRTRHTVYPNGNITTEPVK